VRRALIAVGSLPPDLGVRDPIIWLADGVVAEDLIRPDVNLDRIRKMMTAPTIAGAMTCIGGVTRDQLELTVDTVLTGLRPD
jgi:hypothetical protein